MAERKPKAAPVPPRKATPDEVAKAEAGSLRAAEKAAALNVAMRKALDMAGLVPLVRDCDKLEAGFGFTYTRPSSFPDGGAMFGIQGELYLTVEVADEKVLLKLMHSGSYGANGAPDAAVSSSGTSRSVDESIVLADLLHKCAVAGAAWKVLCPKVERRFPPSEADA